MLEGYYLKRWEWYLREVSESLENRRTFDDADFDRRLRQWMLAWSEGQEPYATEPSGDSVTVAGRLWKKYQGSFKPDTVSLCTDKPVTCSHVLPGHAARLANDGWSQNTDAYWANE